MHISDCCQFSNIHISQGSVATYLRCGGIFKYELLQIYQWVCQWKNFENRLTFGEVMGKSLVSCFLRHSVQLVHMISRVGGDASHGSRRVDEKLFSKILTYPNHVLRTLLPPPTAQNYSLRNRPHNRQLPDRISRITDCNFIVRMLYRNMYWLIYIYFRPVLCFILVYNCGLTVRNKRICYVVMLWCGHGHSGTRTPWLRHCISRSALLSRLRGFKTNAAISAKL